MRNERLYSTIPGDTINGSDGRRYLILTYVMEHLLFDVRPQVMGVARQVFRHLKYIACQRHIAQVCRLRGKVSLDNTT